MQIQIKSEKIHFISHQNVDPTCKEVLTSQLSVLFDRQTTYATGKWSTKKTWFSKYYVATSCSGITTMFPWQTISVYDCIMLLMVFNTTNMDCINFFKQQEKNKKNGDETYTKWHIHLLIGSYHWHMESRDP